MRSNAKAEKIKEACAVTDFDFEVSNWGVSTGIHFYRKYAVVETNNGFFVQSLNMGCWAL